MSPLEISANESVVTKYTAEELMERQRRYNEIANELFGEIDPYDSGSFDKHKAIMAVLDKE